MAVTRKKKVAKKKAVRRSKSTELATMDQWEKRLAEAATAQSAKETMGAGNTISTRNGKFSYQGTNIGTEMDVVVLGFSHVRSYYDQPFNADELNTPACFAISANGNDEAPHEDSPAPQADACIDCDWDAWGSAESGNGKRCRQHRRLAIMSYQDDLSEADVAMVNIAPASIKNWKGYVKKIEKQLHRPCYGVATRMYFDPDAEYDLMCFDLIEKINKPVDMQVIMDAVETIDDALLAPYDVSNYEPPTTRKKASKKKVAKKRGSKFAR